MELRYIGVELSADRVATVTSDKPVSVCWPATPAGAIERLAGHGIYCAIGSRQVALLGMNSFTKDPKDLSVAFPGQQPLGRIPMKIVALAFALRSPGPHGRSRRSFPTSRTP